jgi:hypothetical protein
MAQILDSFPGDDRADGRVKYPWDVWLDGKPRDLTRGVDFTCSTVSFYRLVHHTARKRGIMVRTFLPRDRDVIAVQAVIGHAPKEPTL